jgi:hypothetical protein
MPKANRERLAAAQAAKDISRVEPTATRGFARQAYSGMPEASQGEKAAVASHPVTLASTASADSVEGRAQPLTILPRDGSRALFRRGGLYRVALDGDGHIQSSAGIVPRSKGGYLPGRSRPQARYVKRKVNSTSAILTLTEMV